MRNLYDILVAITLGLIGVIVALALPEGNALRTILALPLLLIVPGYLLAVLFMPGKDFGFAEHLGVSTAGSLAVLVLLAFAIHYSPWAIDTTSWTIGLAVVIVSAGSGALLRRLNIDDDPEELPTQAENVVVSRFSTLFFGFSPAQTAMMSLAVVITIAAAILASAGQSVQHNDSFSQLWIIPEDEGVVTVGMQNMEYNDAAYLLEVTAGEDVLGNWQVALPHEESWQRRIAIPADLATNQTITANLYLNGNNDEIYRTVHLRPANRE